MELAKGNTIRMSPRFHLLFFLVLLRRLHSLAPSSSSSSPPPRPVPPPPSPRRLTHDHCTASYVTFIRYWVVCCVSVSIPLTGR